ncbi:DUF1489 family protein [Arenibaculum pallidiluteum]|uniref:DUF1489 family protein n=1 Tax=Arenibaculum pallidiluteum TaxID=2812559 RepID=UPI001A97063E|nr:DUF1489 domain-containing protein [Arenibaculum pallidiluteum]
MPLHLVKLCVGCDSIADLRDWIAENRDAALARGETYEQTHTTRSTPRRSAEILEGGSLYWVIRGAIQVRQRITAIRPVVGADGIGRCRLVLDHAGLVATALRPMRPFQGWRYLSAEAAPPDTGAVGGDELPEALRMELSRLGLL